MSKTIIRGLKERYTLYKSITGSGGQSQQLTLSNKSLQTRQIILSV